MKHAATFLAAFALSLASVPLLLADGAPQTVEVPKDVPPPHAMARRMSQSPPAQQPQIDLSRSVTVTGFQLRDYVAAEVARARAQMAEEAAQAALAKVRDALVVKPEASSETKPAHNP